MQIQKQYFQKLEALYFSYCLNCSRYPYKYHIQENTKD